MIAVKPGIAHQTFYEDFAELLKKHDGNLDALEMLALVSNLVGKLVAMQDQRKVTPQQAMDVVRTNLEAGNKAMVDQLLNAPATRPN